MKHCLYTAPLLALGLTNAALADDVVNDDLIVTQSGCFGSPCTNGETFTGGLQLKIKSLTPTLIFEDTTTGLADWRIQANSGNVEGFYIRNQETNVDPLTIAGSAPANSVFVGLNGAVGLGTALPESELHVVSPFSGAGLTLEKSGGSTGKWRMDVGGTGLAYTDLQTNNSAVVFENGAPEASFWVADDGNIGLGTGSPSAQLELSSSDSFNFFRISATGAAVNESVDITFTGGPLGTGQLRYNIVDGDAQEMSLDADGNMVLDGTLTTAGPTCASGCDRVFDDDYALLSIEDRAAMIAEAGYLPALGPTVPHAPLNVTEKLAGVINELEHAHLYIAQQQAVIARQDAENAKQHQTIEEILARLATLEQQ